MIRIASLFFATGLLASANVAGAADFELADGDRVVLVGNTFIERDQSYGYLETTLVSRHPGRNITFRNLGWSGDTVFGEARAGFDSPAEGFRRLTEHVEALKPTVILVGYGGNEAFAGEAGLPRFLEGLNALLDALAATGARILLLSPTRQEDLGRPLPDPTRHNHDLRTYRDAIRKVAEARRVGFLDLFDSLVESGSHLTDDEIHLTAFGYWRAAEAIGRGLGMGAKPWRVEIGRDGTVRAAENTKLAEVRPTDEGLRFQAADATLPTPLPPAVPVNHATGRVLRVTGLEPGEYVLKIDGMNVARASAAEWGAGVALAGGPEFDQVEQLRDAINAKNRLYFFRWRPQNETYLFGFRKHEQGQNAAEIPRFDPLVAEREAVIAKLRVPTTHTYELQRAGEGSR